VTTGAGMSLNQGRRGLLVASLLALLLVVGLSPLFASPASAVATPSVAITAPAAEAVVSGIVDVSATGVMPAELSYELYYIYWYVDGSSQESKYCSASTSLDSKQCTLGFTWDTTGLSGTHTLRARFYYSGGSVESGDVTVHIWSGSRVDFEPVATSRRGVYTTVWGQVKGTADGQPIANAKVVLTDRPAIGSTRTLTVRTDSSGWFSIRMLMNSNHRVTASVRAGSWFGSSRASYVAGVAAPITCRLNSSSLRAGRTMYGSCRIPGLPHWTQITMQYQLYSTWYTFSSWSAYGPSIPFSVRTTNVGRYTIRMVVSGNAVFARTSGPRMRFSTY